MVTVLVFGPCQWQTNSLLCLASPLIHSIGRESESEISLVKSNVKSSKWLGSCIGAVVAYVPLWMTDVRSHHQRNPGMIRFQGKYQQTVVISHVFKVVRFDFVHPQYVQNALVKFETRKRKKPTGSKAKGKFDQSSKSTHPFKSRTENTCFFFNWYLLFPSGRQTTSNTYFSPTRSPLRKDAFNPWVGLRALLTSSLEVWWTCYLARPPSCCPRRRRKWPGKSAGPATKPCWCEIQGMTESGCWD